MLLVMQKHVLMFKEQLNPLLELLLQLLEQEILQIFMMEQLELPKDTLLLNLVSTIKLLDLELLLAI